MPLCRVVMGYTQYLNLAPEHRSLGLIETSFRGRTDPFILLLNLDPSSLLSLSSLYHTESLFIVRYGDPVTRVCFYTGPRLNSVNKR
jgi:hypothetical protein